MRITGIRLQRLRLPLEPAFHAAWDPTPRRAFDATLVRVETDAGLVGLGSGDTMAGFDEFEHLFRHVEQCFEGGMTTTACARTWVASCEAEDE